MKRRRFIKGITAIGGIAVLRPKILGQNKTRFDTYPFSLGVASGDATSQGVVLWTRLAPDPVYGGMDPIPVAVDWQVGTDEKLSRIILRGRVLAQPEQAHSLHIELEGLEPDRHYWYRFIAGNAESPIGRTKTLPEKGKPVGRLQFAAASCQHWELGLFNAYDDMAAADVDFCIHLGDYIYDVPRDDFRIHESKESPKTLAQYRARHALYKTDPSLQAAHRAMPFFAVPDNHDAIPDKPESPESLAQRAAAYQAWYEHMPIRGSTYSDGTLSIHREIDIGNLARINLLDTRQFRDNENICQEGIESSYGFGNYRPLCKEVNAPGRSMLGTEQEAWLLRRLENSQATWNVLASTVLFSPFRFLYNGKTHFYKSSWDGYPANRNRIMDTIKRSRLSNPIVLSGDMHSSWAINLPEDPSNFDSPVAATEFLCTSISSDWPDELNNPIEENLANNPHVLFYDGKRRGYCQFTVSQKAWETKIRSVKSTRKADSPVETLASFEVEAGKPGARRI